MSRPYHDPAALVCLCPACRAKARTGGQARIDEYNAFAERSSVPSIGQITPFEEVYAKADALCRRPWHPADLLVSITFGLVLCGALLPLRVFFALGGLFLAATLWQRRIEIDWQIHEAALVDRFEGRFEGRFSCGARFEQIVNGTETEGQS